MSTTEFTIFRDGDRRIVVTQAANMQIARSDDYRQLFVRVEPIEVTIEQEGTTETINLGELGDEASGA